MNNIEQRLRAIRPRKPHDCLAEISTSDPSNMQSASGAPLPFNYPSSTFVGSIAASWVGGAAIGAVCVFFVMSRDKPPLPVNPMIVESKVINSNPIVPLEGDVRMDSSLETPIYSTSDIAEWTKWQFDTSPGQLAAGGSLRNLRLERERYISAWRWPNVGTQRDTVLQAETTNAFGGNNMLSASPILDSRGPMTRSELLRELLSNSTDSVH